MKQHPPYCTPLRHRSAVVVTFMVVWALQGSLAPSFAGVLVCGADEQSGSVLGPHGVTEFDLPVYPQRELVSIRVRPTQGQPYWALWTYLEDGRKILRNSRYYTGRGKFWLSPSVGSGPHRVDVTRQVVKVYAKSGLATFGIRMVGLTPGSNCGDEVPCGAERTGEIPIPGQLQTFKLHFGEGTVWVNLRKVSGDESFKPYFGLMEPRGGLVNSRYYQKLTKFNVREGTYTLVVGAGKGSTGEFAVSWTGACAQPATAVTVTADNRRIADVGDVIWKQSFPRGCEIDNAIGVAQFDSHPFSAPAGRSATLNVDLEFCPSLFTDPVVFARWTVKGTRNEVLQDGTTFWTGNSGRVTLLTPNKIGVYPVELELDVNGVTTTLTRKLLVTKRDPLSFSVSVTSPPVWVTPRRIWYERAIDWGKGSPSDPDTDEAIFERTLDGLYEYGGDHWRYGYDFGSRKKCLWTELVDDPLTCDYADCYVFSDVFESMNGVLGVGGLLKDVVNGSAKYTYGFVTTGAPSLDPKFKGSARPRSGGELDRYWFSSHSLRKRCHLDDRTVLRCRYYDATFNGIYGRQEEFIAWRLTDRLLPFFPHYTGPEGAKLYLKTGNSYDSWKLAEYEAPPAPGLGDDFPAPPAEDYAITGGGIAFTGNATYTPQDHDADGIAERLRADVEVEVREAGGYLVLGVLEKDGEPVAVLPELESMLASTADLSADPGIHTVSLYFSGEQIFRSGADGPYDLVLDGIGDSGTTGIALRTPALTSADFGERRARLVGATEEATDSDGDGTHETLEARVGLDVRVGGSYALRGGLIAGEEQVSQAAGIYELSAGTHTKTLVFDGNDIRRSAADGPYQIAVSLADADQHTIDGLELATTDYAYETFEPHVEPTGAFREIPVDRNGDGLYERLRVELEVQVSDRGPFSVSGVLSDAGGTHFVNSEAELTLAPGRRSFSLDFSGASLRRLEVDGPYTIQLAIGDGREVLDMVDLEGVTSAFRFSEFASFEEQATNHPPIADAGAPSRWECEGDLAASATLDGSGSRDPDSTADTNDDIVSFEWFDGLGPIATGEYAVVSLELGTHKIDLTVTDRAALTDEDSVSVTVEDTLAPSGAIVSPADGTCFGGQHAPVRVSHDFSDVCDPEISVTYDPAPGPTYGTHGDHLVAVRATDTSANESSSAVSFTIDLRPPGVELLSPAAGSLLTPETLPLSLAFVSNDDDGAWGSVVHEWISLDACVVYDGETHGNGDGLLADESISLTLEELCRIADKCGFRELAHPTLSVHAGDCAGNVAQDATRLEGALRLRPGICE